MKDAETITDQNVLETILQQQLGGTDATRASTVDDDTDMLFRLIHKLERVIKSTQNSNSGPLLVGM